MTVNTTREYIHTKLLNVVDDETLAAHCISLPVFQQTVWSWMLRCDAALVDEHKCYYNDLHEDLAKADTCSKERSETPMDIKSSGDSWYEVRAALRDANKEDMFGLILFTAYTRLVVISHLGM